MGCMMHCWQILGSGSYIPNSAFGLPGRSLRDSTLDAGLRVAVLLQDARRVQQCRWWKGRGGLPLVHFFGNPPKKKQKKRLSCSSIWSGWQGFFFKAGYFNPEYVLHWNFSIRIYLPNGFCEGIKQQLWVLFHPSCTVLSQRLGPHRTGTVLILQRGRISTWPWLWMISGSFAFTWIPGRESECG